MGNDKFIGQIDDELKRLQGELESTKKAMEKATEIFEECKGKQQRLIQEMKAVDLMKQNLSGLTTEQPAQELQQPPADYFKEKEE